MLLQDEMAVYLVSTGAMTEEAARSYIQSCQVIVLDGVDEAASLNSGLWTQINQLIARDYEFTTKVRPSMAIPPQLTDAFVHDGKKWVQKRRVTCLELEQFKLLSNTSEVSEFIDEAVSAVKSFYPRVVVTCRDTVEMHLPPGFCTLKVEKFDDEQLKMFVGRWFVEEPGKAEELLQFLFSDDNAAVLQVCRTPIVASIVAALHENNIPLPQTRTEIYERRFELLMEGWKLTKDMTLDARVSAKNKKLFLADIAFDLHTRHSRVFSRDLAERLWVARYKEQWKHISLDEVIEQLLVADNVIVREGADAYSLGHLSYQEFLAAYAIVYRQRKDVLLKNCYDSWWRNVAIFYCGLVGDMQELVEKQLDQAGLPSDLAFCSELAAEAQLTRPDLRDFVKDWEQDDAEFQDLWGADEVDTHFSRGDDDDDF